MHGKLCAGTQQAHIHSWKRFAGFLERSRRRPRRRNIRGFNWIFPRRARSIATQPHHDRAAVLVSRDVAATGSCGRDYHLRSAEDSLVMSPDETRRLLAVASSLKVRVLLGLGYGCGLRAGEVVRLKVKHIDSAQKIIRVEQSKSRKDRNVMLSPDTLELLRQWWKTRRRVSIPQLPWRSAGCFQAKGPVSR